MEILTLTVLKPLLAGAILMTYLANFRDVHGSG
jgi:hypothetical protein